MVGGICGQIKTSSFTLFPHQRSVGTEGLEAFLFFVCVSKLGLLQRIQSLLTPHITSASLLFVPQCSALTEKIVAVLPRMRCPHRLEPHQIQGLDFIHIFPVIQWLVKLAIATREEMGDYIRAFSESQFSKDHKTSEVRQENQSNIS